MYFYNNGKKKEGYELCVCCNKKVNIFRSEEIESRPFYIEGAGQLCFDCFHELYSIK